MGSLMSKKWILIVAALMMLSSIVDAKTTDNKTRGLLIEKLTRVYLNLAPSEPSKLPITLRLADLHAERGRIEAMEELDSGCVVCEKGREDRLKAIEYYQEALPKLTAEKLGTVLAQLGHLFQLVGQKAKAVDTYQKILAKNKNPMAMAEAHLSLGEIYFRKNQFNEALKHYDAVLSINSNRNKGLAAFRRAWCHFNLGKVDPAIEGLRKILSTPALLTRAGTDGVINVDKQFQEEVSRDFATFLSRKTVDMAVLQELYRRSPESSRQSNVAYLAKELERLGKKPSAVMVWRFALEKESEPKKRLEGMILMSQIERELNLKEESVRDYKMALRLWPSVQECKNAEDVVCKEMKARLRKYVLDWNRVEKKNPTEELFTAYKEYLRVFPLERDMNIWAAQVARKLKKHDVAIKFYQKGAALVRTELASAKTAKDKKELADLIETLLLNQIEEAELSKNKALLVKVYDNYLKTSPNKKKVVEVRYQKARLFYDESDYKTAVTALGEIARLTEGSIKVRRQAAELALDSLVILKDDQRLEKWALEFAELYPKSSREFRKIARTSILNQTAKLAGASTSSSDGAETTTPTTNSASDIEAWNVLNRMKLSDASVDEKISFYKNKLVLAERLKKFNEARRTADQLLTMKTLKPEDREYAMTRKAWLAEMVLDFNTAFEMTKKMKLKELSPEDRQLKLAMYADLSGKPATPYLQGFLKIKREGDQALSTVSRLVRESKTPEKTLRQYRKVLSQNPKLYSRLVLEIYAKNPVYKQAVKWLKDPLLKGSITASIMKRHLFAQKFEKASKKIMGHKLDDRNQRRMSRSLKRRIALIGQFEKVVQEAVEMGDWTSQILSLKVLADESERFYNEILSLPIPDGLDQAQQQEYMALLSQQASPHQLKANDVRAKLQEFWSNEEAITQKIKDVELASGDIRALAQGDLQRVVALAPETVKSRFETAIAMEDEIKKLPELRLLETARQRVRENPESFGPLNELVQLEEQMGHKVMVSYLKARIDKIPADQRSMMNSGAESSETNLSKDSTEESN